MIALIDYKAGNLTSVRKALAAIEAEVFTPDAPSQIAGADGLIVPGVGHFEATAVLDRPWREAITQALGDRRGINRAGYFIMPMDETLAVAAIDLGGRPHHVVDLKLKVKQVGDLQAELVHDFFEGFSIGARANVHVKVFYGRSSHHHVEAVFKAFARALRVACSKDKQLKAMLPSTKGLM